MTVRITKLLLPLAAAGLAVISSDSSVAATATANLQVTATVGANCTISTATVAFGAYDPIVANASSNLDGLGRVTVTCTKGTPATIALGPGANASGSQRNMKRTSGADLLAYGLYQDSARSRAWGNSGAGLFSAGAAPSKDARNFDVFGRIPSGQDVSAGDYNDTVVATVNF